MFKLLKSETHRNNINKRSSYLTENTLHLHDKDTRLMLYSKVIAVCFLESYEIYKKIHAASKMQSFLMLQEIVGTLYPAVF
jgi:hypothetical protein